MFQLIEEYIQKPQSERQLHLKLNEPCIEIGGYDSREFRGLLAHFLKTTIPTRKKVVLCHACHNHWCSNPHHLYWGTYKENNQDAIDNGRNSQNGWMTGNREASFVGSSKGGKANKGIPKSPEHRMKISQSVRAQREAKLAQK